LRQTNVAQPSARLIELEGAIDLLNAGDLSVALCAVIDADRARHVVDMSAVSFINSSGMAMMLHVHQHATVAGASVTWRGLQPSLMRALCVIGLDSALNIDGSAQNEADVPS
jgi:anti-sigma B factor antagonist